MFRRVFPNSALCTVVAVVFVAFQVVVLPVWVYAEAKNLVGESHPNIILILADDLGWADPGFHGGDKKLTPNIDQLAQQGMRLSQFCMTPVCATSRSRIVNRPVPIPPMDGSAQ